MDRSVHAAETLLLESIESGGATVLKRGRHALIEIGLVLFIITLVVNMLSRLLVWSMNRRAVPKAEPKVEPAALGAPA